MSQLGSGAMAQPPMHSNGVPFDPPADELPPVSLETTGGWGSMGGISVDTGGGVGVDGIRGGGTSTTGIVASILLAVTTFAATQAKPDGVATCHHDESTLRPIMSSVWPAVKTPMASYAVPGPLRRLMLLFPANTTGFNSAVGGFSIGGAIGAVGSGVSVAENAVAVLVGRSSVVIGVISRSEGSTGRVSKISMAALLDRDAVSCVLSFDPANALHIVHTKQSPTNHAAPLPKMASLPNLVCQR